MNMIFLKVKTTFSIGGDDEQEETLKSLGIELTPEEVDDYVFIRISEIESFNEAEDSTYTMVRLKSGKSWHIQMTVDDVIKKTNIKYIT